MPDLVLLTPAKPADPPRDRGPIRRERPSSSKPEPYDDPRYHSRRWQRVAKAVLERDNHHCRIAPGCPERATIADHILPVFKGMTDELFFGMGNLRAACRRHNTARGVAARLEREAAPAEKPTAVVTRDYTRRAG
jgi:hypothetical protein